MPDPEPQVIRSWEWKKTVHGDPCTFHCDLIDYCQLDFYGESHHPLWKGWFDIGRVALREFPEKGPPAIAENMPKKIRAEVTDYIEELKIKNLIQPAPPVKEYVPERVDPAVPYIFKPFPDPLDTADEEVCQLSLWTEIPDSPSVQMIPFQLGPGRHSANIICELEGIRIVRHNEPAPATGRVTIHLPHFPRVQLQACAIWQGHSLLWQERLKSPTIFSNFQQPRTPIDTVGRVESPQLPLSGKPERLRGIFWYSFEDEPDLRSAELTAAASTSIEFTVPGRLPRVSAAQAKKRDEIKALEQEIMEKIRGGMTFYTADKEGGMITETAALKTMLESTAMGFIRADRLTLLKSLRSSLREKR